MEVITTWMQEGEEYAQQTGEISSQSKESFWEPKGKVGL